MTNTLVRIESIYDLSIGEILKKTGNFTILSSNNQNEEMDTSQISPHDVHIGDLERRMGVQIKGNADAVSELELLLKNTLPDAILFNHPLQQDAIYLGKVVKNIYRKKLAILDLGGDKQGILFNFDGQQGDMVLVQIKELTNEKGKLPVCSDLITLSGNYAILEVGSSFVRVSRKIKGDERKRLHNIGKNTLPEGFGIIIRTSATNITEDILKGEIDKLVDVWDSIEDEAVELESPKRLLSGEVQSDIIFGHHTKTYFDTIRSSIDEILPNYHHFKAYSMATGFTLDFAQNFADTISPSTLSEKLSQMIKERDYSVNNHIKAEFHYSDGMHEEINLGDIQSNEQYFITRKILSQNDIDNLQDLELQPKDIMEVIFEPGSWTIHYKYYSENDSMIGQRVKIITPLDLIYRGRIRAFDMGMELFKDMQSGEITNTLASHSQLDMVSKKMISEDLNGKLGEIYRKAQQQLENNDNIILIK